MRSLAYVRPNIIPLVLIALVCLASTASAQVKVVASVKPIHALVTSVMQGAGEPALLVRGKVSPHSYSLRPSDAAMLNDADLVFWVGPLLETFLERPLAALAREATVVTLQDAPGLKILPAREGGPFGGHGHTHAREKAEADPHLWLDPSNAKAMAAAITAALSRRDPANAGRYVANGAALAAKIDALDAELTASLRPLRGKPFIVFHDAYQYLEARYGLRAVGSVTVSPDQRPSAKRVAQLRDKIRSLRAVCIFAEPQFEPAILDTIAEGASARKGVLDPEGADIEPGPDSYFLLMRRLAADLVSCLDRR